MTPSVTGNDLRALYIDVIIIIIPTRLCEEYLNLQYRTCMTLLVYITHAQVKMHRV
jgi:hypothetical protein